LEGKEKECGNFKEVFGVWELWEFFELEAFLKPCLWGETPKEKDFQRRVKGIESLCARGEGFLGTKGDNFARKNQG